MIDKSIFREYDIRGIVPNQINDLSVNAIARAIAIKCNNEQVNEVALGRDGRLSGDNLLRSLSSELQSLGINVLNIGIVTSPLLYFAAKKIKSKSGIMITGSHNPKNYNGLKIIMDNHALAGEEIQNIYNKILSKNLKKINKNSEVGEEKINIEKNYLEAILKDIKINKKLKVAIDAGNGAAGPISLKVYKKLGLEVIDLYCDIDGNFPNHHPNPSEPKNLINLISSVKENKCDIGVAFDGDGDRCLIIDNLGNILWPDRQMMLYSKNILSKNANEKIVFDVKSSKDLPIYIKEYGGIPVMSRTGHSYIKMKMKEINAILGGEMSGHIFFKDRWFGFDDGIYASLRMLEIISNENKKSSEIFDELPSSYSTPEINIKVDKDGNQHEFMKKFCSKVNFDGAEISKIDGLRADFKNGWGLVRASNTTPCLVMRFEANTEEELKEIQDKFTSEILNIDSTLEIPNGKK